MTEPPQSPEGLDSVRLLGSSGADREILRQVPGWHIRVDTYTPLGTQPGETLGEAIQNLIGTWNSMGGFVYEKNDFVADADGWLYTRRGRPLRVFGQRTTLSRYVVEDS